MYMNTFNMINTVKCPHLQYFRIPILIVLFILLSTVAKNYVSHANSYLSSSLGEGYYPPTLPYSMYNML